MNIIKDMKTGFLAALVLYFVALAGTAVASRKKSRSLEDFFLASKSLSPVLMALSLCAAWFGASSILVSADEAWRAGASAFGIVGLPAILTLLLYVAFFVRRIHDLPTVSLSDLVELRYGRPARHLATLLIAWYMVMLAASQMVAAGRILKEFLGASYGAGLAAAAAIVLFYATIGGLVAVVRADSFQFFLLASGILGLFLFLKGRFSFADAGVIAAASGRAGFFDPFHDAGRNALIALSFTLAWTISPVAWQRIQAVRTARKARIGLLLAAVLLAVLYALIVGVGMLFLPFFGPSPSEGLLLSRFIAGPAGPIAGGFLFTAVMAAVLSTMDAAIHTGALSLTRDVYQQIVPRASEKRILAAGRIATLVAGAAAVAVAARFQDILKALGLASQIMAEGLFIPGMAMLFFKRKLPAAGLWSLLLGGGFSILSFLNDAGALRIALPPWPYSVPYGIALGAIGFLAGLGWSRMTGERRGAV